jgi:sugar O-acyltransferase (sialic acid O-acetyltransferase NeuD family)
MGKTRHVHTHISFSGVQQMTANTPERRKLVILGAGLFAEEIANLVSEIDDYELAGFVEGIDPARCSQTLLGLPVIWIDNVAQVDDSWRGVCAVGATERQSFIRQAISSGLQFVQLVHPLAHVARTATLGEGTVVQAGTVVGARTSIGRHVIINRGCLIGHHVQIGDYVTLSPGANVAGKVTIGECSYIGMGAVVLDGISIGSHAVVAAGAVVTHDVPDRVQVLGIPARIIKKLD